MERRLDTKSPPRAYCLADWVVDPDAMSLTRQDTRIRLELKVMQVLSALVAKAGTVVSYQEMMDSVWHGAVVSDDSLYRAVAMLRKALGDSPKKPVFIESIPKVGYRLIAPISLPAKKVFPSSALSNEYHAITIESHIGSFLEQPFRSAIMRSLNWSGGAIRAVRNSNGASALPGYCLIIDRTADGLQSTINCALHYGVREELVANWRHTEASHRLDEIESVIAELIAGATIREIRSHQVRLDHSGDTAARHSYWGLLLLSEQYQSMAMDHIESRRADLERCIAAFPHVAAAHAAIADFQSWHIANGLDAEPRSTAVVAQSHAATAVQLEPDNPYVLAKCGLALSRIGHHNDGAELCRRAHAIAPSLANKESLALTLCFSGECENAVQTYCEILKALPTGHVFQYGRLAVSLVQCGRLEDASTEIERAVLNFPREHFCWVLKANIDAQLGKLSSARAAWTNACELVPGLTLDGVIKGIDKTYARTAEQREFLTKGLSELAAAL